mgnify:CR=1 FL=1
MDLAAQFQRGDTPRGVPAGLHGLFSVHIFNHEDNSSVDVEVERWYQRDPSRILTRTVVDGMAEGDMSTGWDGRRLWMQDHLDDDAVVVYTDDPEAFATDIELNDEQRRLTRLILDALLIDGLRQELRDVRLMRDRLMIRDLDGFKHEAGLVQGLMDDELFGTGPVDPTAPPPEPGDRGPQLQVQLGIDVDTGALWFLRMETVDRSPAIQYELRFDYHSPNRQGFTLPANIRVFENGRAQPRVKFGVFAVQGEEQQGLIELELLEDDDVFDESIFAVPADG